MATITANYDFNLPEVGADDDVWGDLLNANWDKLDGLLIPNTRITQSPDDTTSGRLMKVGDFGLGQDGNLPNLGFEDANDLTISGTFHLQANAINQPGAGSNFSNSVVVTRDGAGGRLTQEFFSPGGSTSRLRKWFRQRSNATDWTSWAEFWTTNNLNIGGTGGSDVRTNSQNDGRFVRLTTNQTIDGNKTFSGTLNANGSGFNGQFVVSRPGETAVLSITSSAGAIRYNLLEGNLHRFSNGDVDILQNLRLNNQASATNHAVRADRSITAGTLLTGGGNLTANRTLNVSVASAAQAQAGSVNTVAMTPLRTAQAISAQTIGVGQTWQDVSGSRSSGTAYQNTTGRPISVAIRRQAMQANPPSFQVSENGSNWVTIGGGLFDSTVGEQGWRHSSQGPYIVPNGHYYRHTNLFDSWVELR